MVSGYHQQVVAGCAKAIHISGGLTKLADARTLREVSAYDHQIRLARLQPSLGRGYNLGVVGSEVDIRKMCNSCHRRSTAIWQRGFHVVRRRAPYDRF